MLRAHAGRRLVDENRVADALALVVAATLHLGVAIHVARAHHRMPAPLTPVTEIELAPPPPPPAPVPEAEPPLRPADAPAPAAPRSAPPAAARAGALLTRKDDAPPKPTDPEPVDFVTDPNGTSYGSGVVARGGTADHGAPGAVAGVPSAPAVAQRASAPAPGDAITPASDLSRAARLTVSNPCRGLYPNEASNDSGDVSLSLVVAATGQIRIVSILSESPPGQGFGRAARACMLAHRMDPAIDKTGAAVTSVASVIVHFSR
jgi:protein TonB